MDPFSNLGTSFSPMRDPILIFDSSKALFHRALSSHTRGSCLFKIKLQPTPQFIPKKTCHLCHNMGKDFLARKDPGFGLPVVRNHTGFFSRALKINLRPIFCRLKSKFRHFSQKTPVRFISGTKSRFLKRLFSNSFLGLLLKNFVLLPKQILKMSNL